MAPVAAVSSELDWRAGGGDLVLGGGKGGAFGGVFALAADRAFGDVVHRRPVRRFLAARFCRVPSRRQDVALGNPIICHPDQGGKRLPRTAGTAYFADKVLQTVRLLAVLSWVYSRQWVDLP